MGAICKIYLQLTRGVCKAQTSLLKIIGGITVKQVFTQLFCCDYKANHRQKLVIKEQST